MAAGKITVREAERTIRSLGVDRFYARIYATPEVITFLVTIRYHDIEYTTEVPSLIDAIRWAEDVVRSADGVENMKGWV